MRTSDLAKEIASIVSTMDVSQKVSVLNDVRRILHEVSPFKSEPVDFVEWVDSSSVVANDYNPNSVAPPEMELLRTSIMADGYTQPIVTNREEDARIVIDGFHRNRVGKECEDVKARILGYLPVVQIRSTQVDRSDRMASTIRHNRARGKHKVDAVSDIVIELKRRNWSDEKISKHLGMDQDEILRLCQITGLQDLFKDKDFSQSWDVEGSISEDQFEAISDNVLSYGDDVEGFRTVNTGDENRIFHTYESWECFKAGFYETSFNGKSKDDCEEQYRLFLSDTDRFKKAAMRVISEWKNSCEHYLTNSGMNRIAWIGQAAMCIETGIPAAFRAGFFRLSDAEQKAANMVALDVLNEWLSKNGRHTVTLEEAYSTKQVDIY